jgi:hypothetical protein
LTGSSKILVGLGWTFTSWTNTVEIVDLDSTMSKCKNLPKFPEPTAGAVGGISNNTHPTICGGGSPLSNKCHTFVDDEWRPSFEMKHEVIFGASAQSANSQFLIISGGNSGSGQYFKDVNVLMDHGWERIQSDLPEGLDHHCMVRMNSTSVISIGGYNGTGRSSMSNTFVLKSWDHPWASGPSLKYARNSHSCARIRKNIKSLPEFSIIVAGGVDTNLLSSVEILDDGASLWRAGPDLPVGIRGAAMVEDPLGGVILIGGESSANKFLDSLYRLSHAGDEAGWIRLSQKLSTGRHSHTAIMVPDSIVDCDISEI